MATRGTRSSSFVFEAPSRDGYLYVFGNHPDGVRLVIGLVRRREWARCQEPALQLFLMLLLAFAVVAVIWAFTRF